MSAYKLEIKRKANTHTEREKFYTERYFFKSID